MIILYTYLCTLPFVFLYEYWTTKKFLVSLAASIFYPVTAIAAVTILPATFAYKKLKAPGVKGKVGQTLRRARDVLRPGFRGRVGEHRKAF